MKKTFRSIITNLYGDFKSEPEQEPSALGLWFDSVCDVPIKELEIEDLCRAIRQEICVPEILPIAVAELDRDMLVGFMADAELLSGVCRLPSTYWANNLLLGQKMLLLMNRDKELIASDSDAIGFSKTLQDTLHKVLCEAGILKG
ncbi:contact-dependent growth inhibition system immunity protein [Pseudomonas gingeri]